MQRGVKMGGILTIDLGVAVHVPHVGDVNRTVWDEHPFVLVIRCSPPSGAGGFQRKPCRARVDSRQLHATHNCVMSCL